MPKKLQVEIAEALIAAIQKRDCLYNTRDACYKNRHLSELAWKAVADEIERDVTFCKATWASLRCTFNRNLANMRNLPSDSSADRLPKWHFFQHMLFMKDYVSHGQVTGSLAGHDDSQGATEGSTGSSGDEEYASLPIVQFDGSQFKLENVDTQVLTPTSNFQNFGEAGTSAGTSTRVPTASTSFTPRPSTHGKRKRSKRQRPAHEVEDDDLNFLRGLLPHFKHLPPVKKLQFMHHTTGYLMELHADENE